MLTQEIISRFLATLVGIYLVSKFGGALFKLFYQHLNDRRERGRGGLKAGELDAMIRAKERELGGDRASLHREGDRFMGVNPLDRAEKKQKSPKPQTKDKRTLALLDAAKWGEGEAFRQIQAGIKKQLAYSFGLSSISQGTNFLLKRDLLLTTKSGAFLEYDKLLGVISAFLVGKSLLEELESGEDYLASSMEQRYQLPSHLLLKGLALWLAAKNNKRRDKIMLSLYQDEQLPKTGPEELAAQLAQELKKQGAGSLLASLIREILAGAKLLETLSPIVDFNKRDREAAALALGVSVDDPPEMIKRQYKRLAARRHPDRFAAAKLEDKMLSHIQNNFTNIQQAYNLLKGDG